MDGTVHLPTSYRGVYQYFDRGGVLSPCQGGTVTVTPKQNMNGSSDSDSDSPSEQKTPIPPSLSESTLAAQPSSTSRNGRVNEDELSEEAAILVGALQATGEVRGPHDPKVRTLIACLSELQAEDRPMTRREAEELAEEALAPKIRSAIRLMTSHVQGLRDSPQETVMATVPRESYY